MRSAAGLAAATALAGCAPITAHSGVPQAVASTVNTTHSFSRIFDLTHTLAPSFPTFGGDPQLELETLVTLANDGYNMLRWLLVEHTGTHMDAPYHFSDGLSADQIAVEDLMGPLAVVDIRAK
ncbi:MAG: cyclase family protein, partial [Caldilinea sp.]